METHIVHSRARRAVLAAGCRLRVAQVAGRRLEEFGGVGSASLARRGVEGDEVLLAAGESDLSKRGCHHRSEHVA